MKRKVGAPGTLTILFLCILSMKAWGAGSFSNFGPEKLVTLDDFRPHLMDEEMYNEQWSLQVWNDDGSVILTDFIISNLGVGDHKSAVKAELRDSSGARVAICRSEYSSDEWSSSTSSFRMTFGKNEVFGDYKTVHVKATCEELSYDLEFVAVASPYQPGSGRIELEKDGEVQGFYRMVFIIPRGNVTGSLNVHDKQRKVKGIGLCEHSYTNLGPQTLARRWFRFKMFKDDVSFIMAEIENPPEVGSTTRGYVMVHGPEGRILATARVRFEYDGWILDKQTEEGYRVPRRVRLVAMDGGTSMTGTLVMKNIAKVNDPLADLDAVRRAIARRFSKPRDYSMACSYSFKIKTPQGERDFNGEDFYRFVFVNP